jgi:hypothetical protein
LNLAPARSVAADEASPSASEVEDAQALQYDEIAGHRLSHGLPARRLCARLPISRATGLRGLDGIGDPDVGPMVPLNAPGAAGVAPMGGKNR